MTTIRRTLLPALALGIVLAGLLPGAPPAGADPLPRTLASQIGGVGVAQSTSGPARSDPRSISVDGTKIVFTTDANGPGDTNGLPDVYLRNTATGVTSLVSRTPSGTAAGFGARHASISGDGQWVAFLSESTDLVAGDTGFDTDVFVFNTFSITTTRVNRLGGVARTPGSLVSAQISADGQHVVWVGNQGIWTRRWITAGPVVRHYTGAATGLAASISGNGGKLAWSAADGVIWFEDTVTGVARPQRYNNGALATGVAPQVDVTGVFFAFLGEDWFGTGERVLHTGLVAYDDLLWDQGSATALTIGTEASIVFTTRVRRTWEDTDSDPDVYSLTPAGLGLVSGDLPPSPSTAAGRPAWYPEISGDGRTVTLISSVVTSGCGCTTAAPRRWAVTIPA